MFFAKWLVPSFERTILLILTWTVAISSTSTFEDSGEVRFCKDNLKVEFI